MNHGKHNEFKVGRSLLSFSFEISMTNSDSLFYLIVAGLFPNSWVKFCFVAYDLNCILFSVYILHLKCVESELGLETRLLLLGFKELLFFPLCYQLAFFKCSIIFFPFHSHYSLPCVILHNLHTKIHLGIY